MELEKKIKGGHCSVSAVMRVQRSTLTRCLCALNIYLLVRDHKTSFLCSAPRDAGTIGLMEIDLRGAQIQFCISDVKAKAQCGPFGSNLR